MRPVQRTSSREARATTEKDRCATTIKRVSPDIPGKQTRVTASQRTVQERVPTTSENRRPTVKRQLELGIHGNSALRLPENIDYWEYIEFFHFCGTFTRLA
ncbi:uncharacterized protein FOMMEDRAFT_152026 [Fomitiporia mediterranea MF3/22]|uniref:uncharacterized protein n=1 Tax=Fomitiporia mediterranea (strain MF3/22) TaxID=694068 RepID=UPI0004407C88|nr:uncharacterized protein FOMMEDRAFT_152026 [Fomitiporia mediterranea MF3/22]EJD06724.1 hypothetical protein FOMMEDRAFT_152026 [Fomitiporia mediterranea MF3/22]